MIDDADIARVRETADLVAIAGDHVQLKRVGRQWMGICPFHEERSPSLSINGAEGLWWCFGCHQGGDTIEFVRRVHHLDFVEAVDWLAARAGITISRTAADQRQRTVNSALTEITQRAAAWYHDQLLHSPAAAAARHYLSDRGLASELLETFQIGWAPAGWDELTRHLGAPRDPLIAAGVSKTNQAGRIQDVFRARITFPIRNAGADVIGFGARLLPGTDGPKYLNSSDGALYQKRSALYGIDAAKAAIVSSGRSVVCEGYLDVIAAHAAGITNAVASCGTALGPDHFRLLGRFCDTIVLAFDADAAGGAAAARLHDMEARFGMELAVAELPAGTDPGDLGFTTPDQLRSAVDHPAPLLGYMVNRALDRGATDSIEARVRTANEALDVVAQHPDRLMRDQYMMMVADRLNLDSGLLRDRLTDVVAHATRSGPATTSIPPDPEPTAPVLEAAALQLAAASDPTLWWMTPALFSDPGIQSAVDALASHGELSVALSVLEGAGQSRLLAAAASDGVTDDVDEVGARLVQAAIERRVGAVNPATDNEAVATITQLRRYLQLLRQPTQRAAAARDGLALLTQTS